MKSHRANTPQRMRTLELFGASLGPTPIYRKLQDEYQDPVSLKTVKNWLADFRRPGKEGEERNPEEAKFLISLKPFTWGDIGQHEIPWEASEFIARLMVENVDSMKGTHHRSLLRIQVLWLWRFSLLAPTLPISRLLKMSGHIIIEQLRAVLNGEPMDFDDIYWWLAYEPWKNLEKHKVYEAAIDGRSRIPRYDETLRAERAYEFGRVIGSKILHDYEGDGGEVRN